jgi:fido (protein-threonine AMPylation protein)
LDSFTGRAGYYVCEVNAVHPFHEGNGRAARFYVDALSARTLGDIFDRTQSTAGEYLRVCFAGFRQGYSLTIEVLKRCASAIRCGSGL